MRNNKSYFMRR